MTFEAGSTVSFIENTAAINGGAVSVVDAQLIVKAKLLFEVTLHVNMEVLFT